MEFILGIVLGFIIAQNNKVSGHQQRGTRQCKTTTIHTVHTKRPPNITSGVK